MQANSDQEVKLYSDLREKQYVEDCASTFCQHEVNAVSLSLHNTARCVVLSVQQSQTRMARCCEFSKPMSATPCGTQVKCAVLHTRVVDPAMTRLSADGDHTLQTSSRCSRRYRG